jgi:hypothetical protein
MSDHHVITDVLKWEWHGCNLVNPSQMYGSVWNLFPYWHESFGGKWGCFSSTDCCSASTSSYWFLYKELMRKIRSKLSISAFSNHHFVLEDTWHICLSVVISKENIFMHSLALTLCRSYLNPYCLGRKTAFFQWAFEFTCKTRNKNPIQGKKIITIKLKKTEW